MGEVYRAQDSKLDREVAIKVLPAAFVEDDQRLARFEREAKALAALNHPNIAAIYGFEEAAPQADDPVGAEPASTWITSIRCWRCRGSSRSAGYGSTRAGHLSMSIRASRS